MSRQEEPAREDPSQAACEEAIAVADRSRRLWGARPRDALCFPGGGTAGYGETEPQTSGRSQPGGPQTGNTEKAAIRKCSLWRCQGSSDTGTPSPGEQGPRPPARQFREVSDGWAKAVQAPADLQDSVHGHGYCSDFSPRQGSSPEGLPTSQSFSEGPTARPLPAGWCPMASWHRPLSPASRHPALSALRLPPWTLSSPALTCF